MGERGGATPTLLTVGHGRADRAELTSLFRATGLDAVVDVRSAPGSRRNPDAHRESLRHWLPEAGIAYRWEQRLGGWRSTAPDSLDVFWRNDSFRGYAGHTRTPEFLAAMRELLEQAAQLRTAVMCAESLWWHCHRRIIADVAVLIWHARVLHLDHRGRLAEHPVTPGARLREDGLVCYDRLPPEAGE